jgi:hypothetical protein
MGVVNATNRLSCSTFTPAPASPPACRPEGWKRVQSQRIGVCDGRNKRDQSSATKNLCRSYNFLKSGLGQGLTLKVD